MYRERIDIPVQERSTTGRNLFIAQVLVEKHWCVRHRPGEIDILSQSLRSSDTVLQGSFVEHVARKFGETRVHAVLHLESYRTVSENDETFEQGLRETGLGCLLVHDDGSELLMITDKDNLFASHDEGDHAFYEADGISTSREAQTATYLVQLPA